MRTQYLNLLSGRNVRKSAFLYMGNSLETAQCHLLLSNKLLSDFDQVITARDKELVSKWAEVKKLESSASKQAKPFESKQKKVRYTSNVYYLYVINVLAKYVV